jgi:hypothetical protein
MSAGTHGYVSFMLLSSTFRAWYLSLTLGGTMSVCYAHLHGHPFSSLLLVIHTMQPQVVLYSELREIKQVQAEWLVSGRKPSEIGSLCVQILYWTPIF